MYIVKKILRDIPSSLFLILGMALTFFLMLNGINIISSINYEKEIKEKESYVYDKSYEIIKPNEKAVEEDGLLSYSSGDFDGKAFLEDVMSICSEYKGNAYLYIPVATIDNSLHGLMAYLCINEEHVVSLDNGDREVITSKAQMSGKVLVPEGMKSYIEDGKVLLNGDEFEAMGLIKDNSIDMSNDDWIIMYEDTSENFRETILYEEGDYIYSGKNGFKIHFQSNTSSGEEYFNEIEEKLIDSGYIVRDMEEFYKKSSGDVYVSDYVIIMQILNIVLIIFSIISCMYVMLLWIDRRSGELMIRKSFGASTGNILGVVIKDLFKLGVISMFVSICIQIIYRTVFPVSRFMISIKLENILMILGGMFAVVVIMLVVPIIKLVRLMPATGIKEE